MLELSTLVVMAKTNSLTRKKKIQALAHLQAQRFHEAKSLYLRVSQIDPLDAEAWFMLGMVNDRLGEISEAEACFRRAADIQPGRVEIHFNLAKTLEAQGNNAAAIESYRNVIKIEPDSAAAYTNMGTLLQAQDELDEALACHREAARLAPLAEAHYNLGNILRMKGCHEEAAESYQAALRLKPDFADAHNNLGAVLCELNRLDEAVEQYESVLQLNPNAKTFFNLGNVYFHQMKYKNAVSSYYRALHLDPNHAETHNNLGSALRRLSRQEGALGSYREALRLKPEFVEAHANMGSFLMERGQLDEALVSFRRALQLDPDFLRARVGEARVFERQGDFDQAYAFLQPLLEIGEGNTDVALAFAALCRHVQRCDDAIAMLERLLKRQEPPLDNYDRLLLHFEAGRLLDAAAEYDRAFSHYHMGNVLKSQAFSTEEYARHIDDLIVAYSADFMARAPRATNASQRPLFILGMPRSGTSLVEQILASHPQVAAAGELEDLNRLAVSLPETLGSAQPYPQCIAELTADVCDRLSQRYFERLDEISRDAPRVSDKMPINFQHLGLIALLFPSARVIHCIRDPLDTCLSCYFQHFADTNPYAYDLENLGSYYYQYRRLMQHWQSVLELPIMEIRYEDLVANQEGVSRDLIAFCGLAWDERCLRFHETKRVVATASYDQVRQPLYQRSVGRWKHYQRFLDPLIRKLNNE